MFTGLVKAPINQEENREKSLEPLLSGKPVVFSINDPRMREKKRIKQPLIFLQPIYPSGKTLLLVSIPGYGSEIVDPKTVRPMELFRAGLSMRAAKILAEELKILFK